jgi:hypothetical protein
MYANTSGDSVHVADEWGLIGSWTAPWNAPANIKIAGAFQMDYEYDGDGEYQLNDGYFNGYLWNSPVSSSDYDDDNPFYGSSSGPKFYGVTAGRIGRYAQAADGTWERGAKGAMAALYVNEGVAGLLTTFAPGSTVGGLSGGFYPDVTGYGGYWLLDGTLTATPMPSANLSDFSLREMGFDVNAGYQSATDRDLYIRGYGSNVAFYLNAFDSELDRYRALPWGIYALSIGGDYDPYDDYYYIPSAFYSGKAADLSGKDIRISGVRSWGSRQGYWLGTIKNTLWTPTVAASGNIPESGEISGVVAGEFMSLSLYGTFGGPFYGLYDEYKSGYEEGSWIGEGVGTYTGQPLAFSSEIDGTTFKSVPGVEGALNLVAQDYFSGIMGGFSETLWEDKTSPIKFIGALDAGEWVEAFPATPFIAASSIASYIPQTSAFTGNYEGFLGVAVDSKNALSGEVTALYDEGGYGGILYSNDITGEYYPESGGWKAQGNLVVYEMASEIFPAIAAMSLSQSYAAGEVPVEVILGGTPDLRQVQTDVQGFIEEPWGIWQSVTGGTYSEGTPRKWVTREVNKPVVTAGDAGVNGAQQLMYNLAAPVNGVSTGTVVGVQAIWDTSGNIPSQTVVMGGTVKGIFDPNTTPLTWTAISQGGFMETASFLNKTNAMSDIERANFERAMKIPAFDVGTASLAGSVADMTVNMNNITFFRGQGEVNPTLWATKDITGSYTSGTKDYTGTNVVLSSTSPNLTGLTQNFTVQQWNTTSGNWGASTSTATPGTLTRSATDQGRLTGASTAITITSMSGLAGGQINTTAKTFSGAGAGPVVSSTPVP